VQVCIESKIFSSIADVVTAFAPRRARGERLVSTNGCFDLLHAGHVHYLAQASQLGDILVVALNSDRSVRALKGPSRPLQLQSHRLLVMAAVAVVDAVVLFDEPDPRLLLSALKPDVHVKGGDYTPDIVERETVERNGGVVSILSFLPGYSTTELLSKIRELPAL
jgi:rfaE bifunctional protein nucleotidyltransferase chain/domain